MILIIGRRRIYNIANRNILVAMGVNRNSLYFRSNGEWN